MTLNKQVEDAKKASYDLSQAPTNKKNKALREIANLLLKNKERIKRANYLDVLNAKKSGLSSAMIDRLTIDDKLIKSMAKDVRKIVTLEDPVGKVLERKTLKNKLRLRKQTVPIGVILIIYESRPNVTIDAASLCIKSGNAVILRGGSDAHNSNKVLSAIVSEALKKAGLPRSVQLVQTTDRKAVSSLLRMDDQIDLVIPRGGEGLIRYVVENSSIPVIMHYKGVCSVYVDKDADLKMAQKIVVNSKCQRPGVCNAAENLLVHRSIARKFLPKLAKELSDVELLGDERTRKIIDAKRATEKDWSTEYLELKLSIKIVKDVDEAISFINRYGSHHTDAIVTKNKEAARRFELGVDSSTIFWNASTRFTDGAEFEMGAEMGISTQKLHARGPMALPELTSYKYIVEGRGQVR